jgi:tRNA A37 threonylcarbamoyladenosine synthetase subunit TsaC/SUA5/YrdC
VNCKRGPQGIGGARVLARSVRAVVAGDVQDSPFEPALARALRGRAATLRRVGAALEVRVALRGKEKGLDARRAVSTAIARASSSAGTRVEVLAVQLEDKELPREGIHLLPASLGSAEAVEAVTAARPDLAPCRDCARELETDGRRHGYVRTECPACGPRYSHSVAVPFTRDRYGLGQAPACFACKAEANGPGDRRFAFERVSCANCGPLLVYQPARGAPLVKAALRRAAERLHAGEVVAVATPYGFVAASTFAHIGSLRVEIADEFAPLSAVVGTPASARALAALSSSEAATLFSAEAPEVCAAPSLRGRAAARELSVFGGSIALRAPDCPALLLLARDVGPLAVAAASRGGAVLPSAAKPGEGLPTAGWLSDGGPIIDPVPPARGYMLGRQWVLLAHGRGSLPASVRCDGAASALAFGGGLALFGAAAAGGTAYLTGNAGPSGRADTAGSLRRLISRAAALSPAARADAIDFVATSAEEGSPARFAAEETAADADCEVRVVSSAAARAASACGGPKPRAAAAVVLNAMEPAAAEDAWLGVQGTGGEVIGSEGAKLVGGIAPFHVVEAPGGRNDLLAPLASLFDASGLVLEGRTADDAPLLDLLRARATTSSSFVQLVDGVAAALGLVPRRAPQGAGLAEAARAALDRHAGHRYRFSPTLKKARGSKQADAAGLLVDLANHRHGAQAREGVSLAWDRRAALSASFLVALLDGVAMSARVKLSRRAKVALTGSAFAERAVLTLAMERLRHAGLEPVVPFGVPLLDGALPIGQLRLASAAPQRKNSQR